MRHHKVSCATCGKLLATLHVHSTPEGPRVDRDLAQTQGCEHVDRVQLHDRAHDLVVADDADEIALVLGIRVD